MADTAEALQAVIVISDGFELGEEDCQITYTMLKNFMEVNMAFVFGIFPNGEEKIFNLTEVQQAVYAFALSFGSITDKLSIKNASSSITNGLLTATWNDLMVKVPVKPDKLPHNL